jgi:hypothetical protein
LGLVARHLRLRIGSLSAGLRAHGH